MEDATSAHIQVAFGLFDVDGSGDLDADELTDALSTLGVHTTREEVWRMVERFAKAPEDGSPPTTLSKLEFEDLVQSLIASQNAGLLPMHEPLPSTHHSVPAHLSAEHSTFPGGERAAASYERPPPPIKVNPSCRPSDDSFSALPPSAALHQAARLVHAARNGPTAHVPRPLAPLQPRHEVVGASQSGRAADGKRTRRHSQQAVHSVRCTSAPLQPVALRPTHPVHL
ncbi:hypothetical protein AB1Y20_020453 [Prymnesium parvum]|uniref:EF-hand domain-containing protein n=1 Tax=Prymnesium parvum TaxID=97485 RepID=A0AB34JTQ2_PRYPA